LQAEVPVGEVKNMNKLGRYSESFLEDYKENIQKA
jgi:hypothetical protein